MLEYYVRLYVMKMPKKSFQRMAKAGFLNKNRGTLFFSLLLVRLYLYQIAATAEFTVIKL